MLKYCVYLKKNSQQNYFVLSWKNMSSDYFSGWHFGPCCKKFEQSSHFLKRFKRTTGELWEKFNRTLGKSCLGKSLGKDIGKVPNIHRYSIDIYGIYHPIDRIIDSSYRCKDRMNLSLHRFIRLYVTDPYEYSSSKLIYTW